MLLNLEENDVDKASIIIREGYTQRMVGLDTNKVLYKKYPELEKADKEHFDEYGSYGDVGGITGNPVSGNKYIVTFFVGEEPGTVVLDNISKCFDIFETYLMYKGLPSDTMIAFPYKMCGDLWENVKRQVEGIAARHRFDVAITH